VATATSRSGRRSTARTVDGDGVAARDQRTVGTVNGLDVSGSIVVDVRVGPATSLVVEADSNLLPLIRTDVRGDTLNIYTDRSYRSRNPVHVIYTVPRLTDLRRTAPAASRCRA
jgi:hypothetical protein